MLGVDCVAPALCPGYCGTENSFKRDVKKAVRAALCVCGGGGGVLQCDESCEGPPLSCVGWTADQRGSPTVDGTQRGAGHGRRPLGGPAQGGRTPPPWAGSPPFTPSPPLPSPPLPLPQAHFTNMIEMCLYFKLHKVLFGTVFDPFQESALMRQVYFDTLEPFILAGR